MAKGLLWPLERIQNGLQRFFKEKGRFPTATEFDDYQHLPRAKTIERRFGGLIELRKQLKLETNTDLRTGEHSRERTRLITTRAHKTEQTVYDFLQKQFKKEFVHREFFFTDDHRTRADFFVYDKGKGFCVDVFYPNSLRNLTGCLNIKLTKYSGALMRQYPVLFLQMNASISQEELDMLVKRKERPLAKDQYLMCWETFERFCKARRPLSILKWNDGK